MMRRSTAWIGLAAFCLLVCCSSLVGFAGAGHAAETTGININTASVAELVQLPRVGDKVAQRIVDYRQEHGAFKTVDDLKAVQGIGDKIFEQIRPMITVK